MTPVSIVLMSCENRFSSRPEGVASNQARVEKRTLRAIWSCRARAARRLQRNDSGDGGDGGGDDDSGGGDDGGGGDNGGDNGPTFVSVSHCVFQCVSVCVCLPVRLSI